MSMRPAYCQRCGESITSGPFHWCKIDDPRLEAEDEEVGEIWKWYEEPEEPVVTATAVPECDHTYHWMSPAGARRSARICSVCGWPDPDWLNHTVEVDLSAQEKCVKKDCVHCEYAEKPEVTESDIDALWDRIRDDIPESFWRVAVWGKDGNWDPGALDVADRRRIAVRILEWVVNR